MPQYDDIINEASTKYGLDPQLLRTTVQIESGGNPNAQNGSHTGLTQLLPSEFERYGTGDINNPRDNILAAAAKMAAERDQFRGVYGRDPTHTEAYLTHQQGWGGIQAHLNNPSGAAWENMASTAEGRTKGPEWAKSAIWGNVPDDMKRNFPGGVESVSSQDFMDLWDDKMRGQQFNGLLQQYRDHMSDVKQRYGQNSQPPQQQPQPGFGVDPRAALLLSTLNPYQSNQTQNGYNGMPSYANPGNGLSPSTMNYLNLMLRMQKPGVS